MRFSDVISSFYIDGRNINALKCYGWLDYQQRSNHFVYLVVNFAYILVLVGLHFTNTTTESSFGRSRYTYIDSFNRIVILYWVYSNKNQFNVA